MGDVQRPVMIQAPLSVIEATDALGVSRRAPTAAQVVEMVDETAKSVMRAHWTGPRGVGRPAERCPGPSAPTGARPAEEVGVSDPAALTDEELAAMDARNYRAIGDVPRLIAALHASRQEVETINALVAHLEAALRASRAEVERLGEQNDGLYQAALRLGAEVERLQNDIDELHHASQGWSE